MLRTYNAIINYSKKKFSAPPTIKILDPPNAKVVKRSKKEARIRITINPHADYRVEIRLLINGEEVRQQVQLSICPACTNPLQRWPVFALHYRVKSHSTVQSIPVSVCPACGNLFVSRDILHRIISPTTNNIIIP